MNAKWPVHNNGRPKKIGEMNAEERHAVFEAGVKRVKSQFESPKFQKAISDFLSDDPPKSLN
jgi:hypothetical protein